MIFSYKTFRHALLSLLLVLAIAANSPANAGDLNTTSGLILEQDLTASGYRASFFTYTGMRALIDADEPKEFTAVDVSPAGFPALDGQNVSCTVLLYPPNTVNPPHAHPDSAELLFVLAGSLEVGFIDTAGKLYSQALQVGDMFVFQKGLAHYQYSSSESETTIAVAAYGTANPGFVSVPGIIIQTRSGDSSRTKASSDDDEFTIEKVKAAILQTMAKLQASIFVTF